MSDPVDHYKVLGLSTTSSTQELYTAYCDSVRHWLQNDPSFNHNTLEQLQNSYRVLQDPFQRYIQKQKFYGHLQENQPKYFESQQQKSHVKSYKSIQENQPQCNKYLLQENQPHYYGCLHKENQPPPLHINTYRGKPNLNNLSTCRKTNINAKGTNRNIHSHRDFPKTMKGPK